MAKIASRREQVDFLLRRRFGTLAPPPVPTLGEARARTDAAMERAGIARNYRIAGKTDPTPSIDKARAEYDAMPASEIQRLVDEARAEMTRAWEQER